MTSIQYTISREALFYHAVTTALYGDYFAVAHAKQSSWESTWNKIAAIHTKHNPERLAKELEQHKIIIVFRDDPDYPRSLKEIPNPPHALYVRGSLAATAKPCVSIVGTRKATPYGKRAADTLAQDLVRHGCTIISGLALGIDEAAHRGALAAGGWTIAVLACGLDEVYPAQSHSLANQIIETGGAIISEYPLHSETRKHRFLERNRIISGLSLGTVVVEAPTRSGALATAHFALEQNREVFAVPGPITSANHVGCHRLIKQGARLVTRSDDIIESLEGTAPLISFTIARTPPTDPDQALIYATINEHGSCSVDKLVEITKLPPHAIIVAASCLTLSGHIVEDNDGYVVC